MWKRAGYITRSPERGSTAFIGTVNYKKVIKNVLDKFPKVWDNVYINPKENNAPIQSTKRIHQLGRNYS